MPATKIVPALPTSDLRSESKATRRGKSQAVKWAHGGRPAAGKQCTHNSASCGECIQRPCRLKYTTVQRLEIREQARTLHRRENVAKKVLQNDLAEVTQDSGSDEDVMIASYNEAPVPRALAEAVYSYDARGPTDGQDILSNAVMQAVKRFENKQVEQLVKNEYDTLPDRYDFEVEEETEAYSGDAEEDEYDIVDHQDLH